MAKARKILARRNAVGNIHTVTRTMEMVATARFRSVYSRYEDARAYIDGMADLVEDIITRSQRRHLTHPLLRSRTGERIVLLVTAGDRGLCGAFHDNLLSLARNRLDELHRAGRTVDLRVAGKQGLRAFRFEGVEPDQALDAFTGDVAEWHRAMRLANELMDDFVEGKLAGAELVGSAMTGPGRHEPARRILLPLQLDLPADLDENDPHLPDRTPYEFLPSRRETFARLLPMTVRLRLFQWVNESAIAEQLARMAAMRAASESAEEMINDLTVQYNRTRQNQITTELAEIIGGGEGFRK